MGSAGRELGSAWVKIDLSDLEKLDLKVDDSGRRFTSQFGKMETRTQKLGRAFSALGGIIATIGMVKLGTDILKASTTLDTLNLMLINVEGSQAKANKRFEEFRQLAKAPVLDPFNLSSSYVALRAVNVEANLSIRFMKGLGNAMAGVGAGNEQFKNAMYQVVQMAGATKLLGQDLRVINESFPQMRKYLKEAFGTADPEELAKAGITATDVMTKLSDIFEKLPRFTGGAMAAQDNFRQSLMLLEGALGKTVLPSFTKLITGITELMDKFNEMPEATKNVIGKAVVGGLGILGIGAALSSVLIIAGQVKSALVGLGAVNIASGGVGVASGVASGAVAGAVARGTIGTIALTAAKVSLIAGSVVFAYEAAKAITSIPSYPKGQGPFAEQMRMEGKKQTTPDELFNKEFENDLLSFFGKNRGGAGRTWEEPDLQTWETISEKNKKFTDITSLEYNPNRSKDDEMKYWQSLLGLPLMPEARHAIRNNIADLQKEINEELKKGLEERAKFMNELNALAYPQKVQPDILASQGPKPMSIMDLYPAKGAKSTGQPEYTPGLRFKAMTDATDVDRQGLTSGVGTGFSTTGFMANQEAIWKAEKKANNELYANWIAGNKLVVGEIGSGTEEIGSEWHKLDEEIIGGVVEVERAWTESVNKYIMLINSSMGAVNQIGQHFGKDMRGWKYKDPEREKQYQESLKSDEKDYNWWGRTQQVIGDISLLYQLYKNIKGQASGGSGIVTQPTLFMAGEAGPESYNFTPLGKGGHSDTGGVNIIMPIYISENDARNFNETEFRYKVKRAMSTMRNNGELGGFN